MRRTALLCLPALLLVGCGSPSDGTSAGTQATSSSATTSPSITDLFETEMVERGLTPRLGSPEQLRIDGQELCGAYGAGTQWQKANDLVVAGFETPDLIQFAEGVTQVLCPEYATV